MVVVVGGGFNLKEGAANPIYLMLGINCCRHWGAALLFGGLLTLPIKTCISHIVLELQQN